jgi:hypothetical protein
MSIITHALGWGVKVGSAGLLSHAGGEIEHSLDPRLPPPPPGAPNPNDAANAAQATTDQMRMRRGLLANIYGGAAQQQPVSGKTTLGT